MLIGAHKERERKKEGKERGGGERNERDSLSLV